MDERKWNEAAVEAGEFEAFRQIVAALRAENGCPWDREQTFESLKPCMINEMTEALAAINIYRDTLRPDNLCEELGDVLLQVVLLAQIAQEDGLFSMEDVVRGISRKMLRRHPHVFGGSMPEMERVENVMNFTEDHRNVQKKNAATGDCVGGKASAKEIPGLWEAVKRAEKKNPEMERMEKEAFKTSAVGVIRHLEAKLGLHTHE